MRNIALYLSRTKFRPLRWRNTHPYVVVDRYEDITYPQKVRHSFVIGVMVISTLCVLLDASRLLGASLSERNRFYFNAFVPCIQQPNRVEGGQEGIAG